MTCNQNGSKQFHDRKVATLIVYDNNDVEIASVNSLPSRCKYAVSGVLTLENGSDVDWYRRVKPEGWDGSSMYATYRNFLAHKGDTLYLLSGRSTTSNFIYSAEVYNIIKDMGLEACIALDGGGSYIYKENGKIHNATSGTRAVNNIGLII